MDAPLTVVRLAASEPLFAVYEIDRMLSRFAHTHPGIELDLQVADEAALPALAIDSNTEADLALCTVAISGFEARSLRRERLMWVGARGVETDAALRGSIVAVPPFAPASASALEGKRVLRSSSLDAAIRLVRAGLGAMLLPESELARFDMVVLDRTNLPDPTRPGSLISMFACNRTRQSPRFETSSCTGCRADAVARSLRPSVDAPGPAAGYPQPAS
ncbi:MAG: substrate-binding domain-containing protein [Burkholderiaceae bacterium]